MVIHISIQEEAYLFRIQGFEQSLNLIYSYSNFILKNFSLIASLSICCVLFSEQAEFSFAPCNEFSSKKKYFNCGFEILLIKVLYLMLMEMNVFHQCIQLKFNYLYEENVIGLIFCLLWGAVSPLVGQIVWVPFDESNKKKFAPSQSSHSRHLSYQGLR